MSQPQYQWVGLYPRGDDSGVPAAWVRVPAGSFDELPLDQGPCDAAEVSGLTMVSAAILWRRSAEELSAVELASEPVGGDL